MLIVLSNDKDFTITSQICGITFTDEKLTVEGVFINVMLM